VLDMLIRNGYVIDGTGAPGFLADVGVKDGKIAAVFRPEDAPAAEADEVIDAAGLVVSPGFIDIHSHSDRSLPESPRALGTVTQGVTTVVGGNCGGSAAPIDDRMAEQFERWRGSKIPWRSVTEYFEHLEERGLGINLALLVGQGNVRGMVMGTDERAPTADELEQMQRILTEALDQGCVGISSGRRYMPGCLASDEEVIELCQAASKYGCMYTSHIKNQDADIFASIEELVEVGRRTGLPLQLAHMKVCGKPNWGQAREMLGRLEEARREGVDILADVYPYTYTSMTPIRRSLPDWLLEDGVEAAMERLQDSDTIERVAAELRQKAEEDPVRARSTDHSGIVFAGEAGEFVGMSIHEAAEKLDLDRAHAYIELARRSRFELLTAGIMDEEDMRLILRHPYSMVGSDGVSMDEAQGPVGQVHPRSFGTFARVLGYYTRDLGLLHITEAIKKMTSLSAQRLGFDDRGVIREGAWADITVFDLEEVAEQADLYNPGRRSVGIRHVLVNGVPVLRDGEPVDARPGRILKREYR